MIHPHAGESGNLSLQAGVVDLPKSHALEIAPLREDNPG